MKRGEPVLLDTLALLAPLDTPGKRVLLGRLGIPDTREKPGKQDPLVPLAPLDILVLQGPSEQDPLGKREQLALPGERVLQAILVLLEKPDRLVPVALLDQLDPDLSQRRIMGHTCIGIQIHLNGQLVVLLFV